MTRLAVAVAALALLAAPAAAAGVYLVNITPAVHRGGTVSLAVDTIVTVPCSIRVHHGASRPLADPGLVTKENHQLGALRWRWRMPLRSVRGRWSVDLSCGSAGRLHATFLVL